MSHPQGDQANSDRDAAARPQFEEPDQSPAPRIVFEDGKSSQTPSADVVTPAAVRREVPRRRSSPGQNETHSLPVSRQGEEPAVTPFATFPRRLSAALLDTVVLACLGFPCGVMIGMAAQLQREHMIYWGSFFDAVPFLIAYGFIVYSMEGLFPVAFSTIAFLVLCFGPARHCAYGGGDPYYVVFASVLPLLINALYHSVCLSRWQSTLGKRVFGIKVCRPNGESLTFRRALVRHMLKALAVCPPYVGLVAGFRSKSRQCLHDSLTGSLVLEGRGNRAGLPTPAEANRYKLRSRIFLQLYVCLLAVLICNSFVVGRLQDFIERQFVSIESQRSGIDSDKTIQAKEKYLAFCLARNDAGALIFALNELTNSLERRNSKVDAHFVSLLISKARTELLLHKDDSDTLERVANLIDKHQVKFPAAVVRTSSPDGSCTSAELLANLEMAQSEVDDTLFFWGDRICLNASQALSEEATDGQRQRIFKGYNLMLQYLAGPKSARASNAELSHRLSAISLACDTMMRSAVGRSVKGSSIEIEMREKLAAALDASSDMFKSDPLYPELKLQNARRIQELKQATKPKD